MLNLGPRIMMFRRLREGRPCLKGQLEDLKHFENMTFGRYKKYERKQLEECSTE
jgi:hypothetical protein